MEEKIQENTFSDNKSTTDKSDLTEQPSEEPSAISNSDNKQISDALIEEDLARLSTECKSLQDLVQKLEEANANLQVKLNPIFRTSIVHFIISRLTA